MLTKLSTWSCLVTKMQEEVRIKRSRIVPWKGGTVQIFGNSRNEWKFGSRRN
jgi:hypothetical protein